MGIDPAPMPAEPAPPPAPPPPKPAAALPPAAPAKQPSAAFPEPPNPNPSRSCPAPAPPRQSLLWLQQRAQARSRPAAATMAPTPPPPPPPKAASIKISKWWAIVKERSINIKAIDGMFNAAYNDDQDALSMAFEAFRELLNVRQDRSGQRASLAHAAAAGGAMRIVPQLFVAMHTQAMKDGHALLAEELALEEKATDGSKEELEEARLRAAVKYCCRLRDVLGRTALHYAARAGQLGFVQWAIKILCTRPKAASEELLGYVEEKPMLLMRSAVVL